MPRESVSTIIDRPCDEVFDFIHDYSRRLEWDTLLRRAELLGGADTAAKGVRSVCTARWTAGGMAMETVYVSFERGKVAAVKLTNRPLWFREFAATIRHEPVGENQSRVTYIYFFRSRPAWASPILDPIMNLALRHEVRNRLRALKTFLEASTRLPGRKGV